MKLQRDKISRSIHLKFENQCIILKSISKNGSIAKPIRWNSELKFSILLSKSYKTRLVNYCILTGRKNKFDKSSNISRTAFLRIARKGFVPGLKKLN